MQAIYPASIIVLVALNRSHVEKGLTKSPLRDGEITVPTPHVSAILARIRDGDGSHSSWRSEQSKFEPDDSSAASDSDASARTSTYTSEDEERKAGETVAV